MIAREVGEDDDTHLVMMHDGIGDDATEGGGGKGCGSEDDGEDNEEEQDFLEHMLCHTEMELLSKAV
jgi:hypothetical protein